jgi:hypothetical protein
MCFAVVLLAFGLISGPVHFDLFKDHMPYHGQWGPYRITVEQDRQASIGRPMHLLIQDSRHRLVREVTSVGLVRLAGKPPADLHISLWSGGAYCCFTEVFFSRSGHLRNVLIFDGEDLGLRGVTDLNHDGIPEIITENPVLGDFSAYNFHRHYPLVTILGWNGSRYVDVTRRYPTRSLREARVRRVEVLAALKTPVADRREWDLQDKITAYYANMLSIGRGNTARQWLRRHLSRAEWSWLREHDRELRHIVVTAAQRRAYVDQSKVIEQDLHRP